MRTDHANPPLLPAQTTYLQRAAAAEPAAGRLGWGTLLARLWADDTAVSEAWIGEILDECDRREDCTDFRLNMLLRGLALFGDRISDANRERIAGVALAGRYYGGYSRDYPMFYNSENHHLNWAAAEYLAARFWPEATFGFDGRSASSHRTRARFLIARWIDARARWGYREWNSSCYMGVNLLSLLNLVDLADEPDLRELARGACTQMLADLAADSLAGGVWAAQARIYQPQLLNRGAQQVAGAISLLMGAGDVDEVEPNSVADFTATTGYRPPDWLVRLARDAAPGAEPTVNRERHREEKGLRYPCHSAFWKPPRELWDDAYTTVWYPEDIFEFDVRTERCAAYLVSAAITPADFPARHKFAQAMAWLSALKGRVPVFTTHPGRDADRKGRSTYWAGTSVLPRCYLQDGVLAAVYHSTAESHPEAAEFTHAYFPTDQLDEWRRDGRWFLGRLEDAYVGLLAPEGAALIEQGEWAHRDLRAPGRTAAWVACFGSTTRDGELDAFARRCRRIELAFDPSSATADVRADATVFHVSFDEGVFIDGKPFSPRDWKQIDNPVIRSDWGEPVLHIDDGSDRCTLDLSEARQLAEREYARL